MSRAVVLWAWETYERQHLEVLSFEDVTMAQRVGAALAHLQGEHTYSRVRIFLTPYLEELDATP